MLPTGMAFTGVSARALAATTAAKLPRVYWDWRRLLGESSQAYWNGTAPVHFFYGLQEALRMIEEQMPDLVVLDYKMEGMDGLAVTKALRAKLQTQPLPVLMLTAMTDEPSTRAGFEAGVTDYVTKPFSIPQLTARVRACLARTQRR